MSNETNNGRNWDYIERWVKENRPEIAFMLPQLKSQPALALPLLIGFEAGRLFQHENPTISPNDPDYNPT